MSRKQIHWPLRTPRGFGIRADLKLKEPKRTGRKRVEIRIYAKKNQWVLSSALVSKNVVTVRLETHKIS